MSSVLELLTSQLDGNAISEIGRQIGADRRQTGAAISQVLPMMIGALSQNASSPSGAESLFNAVARDHSGSILDNLSGFLGNSQSGPGDAILGHLLGGKRSSMESGLSQSLGLDAGSVAKLLTILAPIVLGAIGRMRSQGGMDAGGLAGMLRDETQRVERRDSQSLGMLGGLLDSDQDGDLDVADIANHGISLVSQFLRQK